MRWTALVFIFNVVGGICVATSPPPFQAGIVQVDRIASALSERTGLAVLQVLADIVGGRLDHISPEIKQAAGNAEIDTSLLIVPEVRAYAAQKVGEIGSDEAIAYLKSLRAETLPNDPDRTVYTAAQIAYRRALLNRESDPNVQRVFLEDLLQRRSDPLVNAHIFNWALAVRGENGIEILVGGF